MRYVDCTDDVFGSNKYYKWYQYPIRDLNFNVHNILILKGTVKYIFKSNFQRF